MGTNLEVETRIREIQICQHGLVTWAQAKDAGLSRKALRHRLQTGRLVRCHHGVYADAAVRPTWEQQVLAAVLASGETAFASHATAARLWGLSYPVADDDPIEVTTVLERDPKLPRVTSHRSGLLLERDIRQIDGIPVSSPERMVLDLSGRCPPALLGRLVDESLQKGITQLGLIADCLERLPRAPGRSPQTVRDVVENRVPDAAPSESMLEQFVLDAIMRHGLPLPHAQMWVDLPSGRRRIDHCYPRQRWVLESDGFGPHTLRHVFDDDRVRSNELVLAGYRILRFTSEFTDWQIACTVAAALGIAPPDPAPEGPKSFKQWRGEPRAGRSSAASSGARSGG